MLGEWDDCAPNTFFKREWVRLVWWLSGFFLILAIGACWRNHFWLGSYSVLLALGLSGWQLGQDVIAIFFTRYWLFWFSIASLSLWFVGGWLIYFGQQRLKHTQKQLIYRGLQGVGLVSFLLPIFTYVGPRWLIDLLWLSCGYFAGGFLAYILASLLLQLVPKPTPTYLVVLGSGLQPDGQLTQTLSNRVQLAMALLTNTTSQIVLSGGQGADEPEPEAIAMARAVRAQGVAADRLHLETQSTSTWENLCFSFALVPANAQIGIVTSNFHLLRAQLYSRRLKRSCSYYAALAPGKAFILGSLRDYLALLVLTGWWQLSGWLLCLVTVCFLV